jgi:hypothetical protein
MRLRERAKPSRERWSSPVNGEFPLDARPPKSVGTEIFGLIENSRLIHHFMRRTTTKDIIGTVRFWVLATLVATPTAALCLSLNPSTGVVPRIFSPNGDGINDMVFFIVENPTQSFVSGVVLDMTGAQVALLSPAQNNTPTPDSLVWNGRDENGHVVPSGPYVYRIDGDGSVLSGVVVVAR